MTSKFEMEGIQECVVICWQYKCKLHNTSTSWVPGEILFHEPVQHKEKKQWLNDFICRVVARANGQLLCQGSVNIQLATYYRYTFLIGTQAHLVRLKA